MDENFPTLIAKTKKQIQESQKKLGRIKSSPAKSPRQIIFKSFQQKIKKNLERNQRKGTVCLEGKN